MLTFVHTLDFTTQQYLNAYANRLNAQDRLLRNHTHHDIITPFSYYEKMYMRVCVAMVDLKIRKYTKLRNIPWNLAKCKEGVEKDMPHTHGEVIFVPFHFMKVAFNSFCETLLHEKLHVFQRLYPIDTVNLYMDYWNITISDYQMIAESNTRTNPDANGIVFSHYDPGKNAHGHFCARYAPTASSIADVVYAFTTDASDRKRHTTYHNILQLKSVRQFDHANETMACLITSIVYNNTKEPITQAWMDTYLKPSSK